MGTLLHAGLSNAAAATVLALAAAVVTRLLRGRRPAVVHALWLLVLLKLLTPPLWTLGVAWPRDRERAGPAAVPATNRFDTAPSASNLRPSVVVSEVPPEPAIVPPTGRDPELVFATEPPASPSAHHPTSTPADLAWLLEG